MQSIATLDEIANGRSDEVIVKEPSPMSTYGRKSNSISSRNRSRNKRQMDKFQDDDPADESDVPYPTSPRIDRSNDPQLVGSANEESDDGWSDDSGKDSDDGLMGASSSSLRSAGSKLGLADYMNFLPKDSNPMEFDDASDGDDSYVHSDLGPSLYTKKPQPQSARKKNLLSSHGSGADRPPSPPAAEPARSREPLQYESDIDSTATFGEGGDDTRFEDGYNRGDDEGRRGRGRGLGGPPKRYATDDEMELKPQKNTQHRYAAPKPMRNDPRYATPEGSNQVPELEPHYQQDDRDYYVSQEDSGHSGDSPRRSQDMSSEEEEPFDDEDDDGDYDDEDGDDRRSLRSPTGRDEDDDYYPEDQEPFMDEPPNDDNGPYADGRAPPGDTTGRRGSRGYGPNAVPYDDEENPYLDQRYPQGDDYWNQGQEGVDPRGPEHFEPPIYKAEYPDADDPEAAMPYGYSGGSRGSRGHSIVISEKDLTRTRRTVTWLIVGLACALVFLAALGGGLVGALIFGEEDKVASASTPTNSNGVVDPGTPAPQPVPTPAPVPVPVQTTASPTVIPTTVPTIASTIQATPAPTTQPPVVATDSPVVVTEPPVNQTDAPIAETEAPTQVEVDVTTEPTSSPSNAPSTPPSVSPAPSMAPTEFIPDFVTDEELFGFVKSVSFDAGAAILEDGTPQNLAYKWLQNEDTLSNSAQRRARVRGRSLQEEAFPPDMIIQRYALACFYYGTNGDGWVNKRNWLDNRLDACAWGSDAPFNCDSENYITIIQFESNFIGGQLVPEIALLSRLIELVIVNTEIGQKLSGGIPSELSNLSEMRVMRLQNNAMTDPIPSNLFDNWASAESINFENNGIPGEIPASVENLVAVTGFNLAGNNLTGSIPPEIGGMVSVRQLNLGNNSLSGPFPSELSSLTDVRRLTCSFNEIEGPFPDISGWTSLKAGLDLSYNQLTGPLPDIFGNFPQLKVFNARNNRLTGEVPESFQGLLSLEDWDLRENEMEGAVPEVVCLALTTNNAVGFTDCDKLACTCCESCQ